MTTASKGLQRALGRTAANAIAIADLAATDLLAEMTDDQKTELLAQLAPKAEASAPKAKAVDDDEGVDEAGKPKKKKDADFAAANATDARVKAVALAVATDDTCKGKADLALSMLADDDFASLSASGIVKLLGKAPAHAEASNDEDGKAMLGALIEDRNADLGAGGGEPKQEANHGWDSIHDEIRAAR